MPHTVRDHIGDVLANLHTPVIFINDILEAKSRRAGDSLVRFTVNSTIGLGGIFDVASGWGYPSHEADFGITLAIWGVGSGPFLYLPVLGPSDPRDAAGFGVGIVSDPFFWVGEGAIVTALSDTRTAVGIVNLRADLLKPIDEVKRMALDPYATFRSLYRQHREAAIEEVRNDHRATTPDWFTAARTGACALISRLKRSLGGCRIGLPIERDRSPKETTMPTRRSLISAFAAAVPIGVSLTVAPGARADDISAARAMIQTTGATMISDHQFFRQHRAEAGRVSAIGLRQRRCRRGSPASCSGASGAWRRRSSSRITWRPSASSWSTR